MSTPAEYPTATEADWERRVRTQAILQRIREELDRVDLEDPALRSVVVTIGLKERGIRTVRVSRETEA